MTAYALLPFSHRRRWGRRERAEDQAGPGEPGVASQPTHQEAWQNLGARPEGTRACTLIPVHGSVSYRSPEGEAEKGPPRRGALPQGPLPGGPRGAGGREQDGGGRGPCSVVWEGGASWGQTEGTVHGSVSVSDAPELCAQKQLRWQVLAYVYLATIQVIIKKAESFTPQ